MARNERASQLEDAQVDNGRVLIWLGQWNGVFTGIVWKQTNLLSACRAYSTLDAIVREVKAHNDG